MGDFAAQFHNLEGDLLGERKKSLYKLLNRTSLNSNQSDIDNALRSLLPQTYQEKLLWVETLVYFKKTQTLIELLKRGNTKFVKVIISQKWFIQNGFGEVSAQELVNGLFPCLSHSTKLKILRKISNFWSEEKIDDLFDAVLTRYGLFFASGILHACSISKIKSLLSENPIVFNTYQVIRIVKRDQGLFKFYVEYVNNLLKKPFSEKNVLNLLAIKNSELFLQLLRSNKIHAEKLTKTASVCVIASAKRDNFKDPQQIFNIVNKRALVKTLGSDFGLFYKKVFPKQLNLTSNRIQILKYIPKTKRWDLFMENYNTNFPSETHKLFTTLNDVTVTMLNPSTDIIRSWAESNYVATNDEKFLEYYPTSTSIPMIKDKINVTSDMRRRFDLLKLLITSCARNKDMDTFSQVLEYIGSRHKNEDATAYKRIIEFICKRLKEQLTKNHWDFIRQQMVLLETGGKVDFYTRRDILNELLCYTYKKDKETFKIIAAEYVQEICDSNYHSFRMYLENPELESRIFGYFCEIIPTILSDDNAKSRSIQTTLISEFWNMCEACSQHCLNLLDYPYLVSAIEAVCNKDDFDHSDRRIVSSAILYHLNFPTHSLPFLDESRIIRLLSKLKIDFLITIIGVIAKKKTISVVERNILAAIFNKTNIEKMESWTLESIAEHMFLFHPKLIFSKFEEVWTKTIKHYDNKAMRYSSHSGLDKKMCEYFKENWSKGTCDQQESVIKLLQNLLPEDEFIQFVTRCVNTEKVVEAGDDVFKGRIQNLVVDLFKNADEPCKFLALIVKSCANVDLKQGLASLYSLFSRSPENAIRAHLKTLSQQPVTIGKHSIFLSCELLDRPHVFNVLNSNLNQFRKFLTLAALKYFVKNSSEDLFSVVKKYLKMVVKNDRRTLSTLVKISVPKKYRAEYVEICWRLLESVDDEKIKVEKYFDKLLEQLFEEDVIVSVSPLFVNDIINNYLSKQADGLLTNVDEFAILCLAHKGAERTVYFELILSSLSKLNKKMVNSFCTKYVNFVLNKRPDATFSQEFLENWCKYLSLTDTLDEYITINLLHKFLNEQIDFHAKSVIDYLEQLTAELGPQVFEIYKDNLKKLMNKMKNFDQYGVFYLMLKYKPSAVACVLVIQLLKPVTNVQSVEAKTAYKNVIAILSTVKEPIVEGCFNIYLRNN